MVTNKSSEKTGNQESAEAESIVTFRLKKPVAIVGGLALAGASIFGVSKFLQSPEDQIRQGVVRLIDEQEGNSQYQLPTTTTTEARVVVAHPDAPPATQGERPDVTVPNTVPELSPEQALLEELAPTFSEIVKAAPSPYDIAIKVSAIPDPAKEPEKMLQADMKAMSLLLTHSFGREEYINALFHNTADDPYPNIDTLIDDASNIGRFRFPPQNDPEYSTDKPSFGVLYKAVVGEDEELSAFYMDGGNIVVIQTFAIERIHFNFDEEQQGWFLPADPYIQGTSVARTYTKHTIPLENDAGETVMTEVWQVDSIRN
ncbi:MAG TPA: hypothetical protein VF996_03255 [Candidatus Saccharimonadales bacterium]|jgi:hypothetical protein